MLVDQRLEQLAACADLGQRLPVADPRMAVQFGQARELLPERQGIVEQMAVVAQQQGHAILARGLDGDAARRVHAGQHRIRQADAPDAAALGLDEHRPGRIEAAQRQHQRGIETLLGGLLGARQGAQQRAAMHGQALEIEHLRAGPGQRTEQMRLAAAGAPRQHDVAQPRRQFVELIHHPAAIGLVAAVELPRAPADQVEPGRHRARALAAAPAVDQRAPVDRPVGEGGFQVRGDVARHPGRADPRRLVGRDLLVHGADDHALVVAQHGGVQRAGNMVLRVLERRAHVDDFVELVDAGQRNKEGIHGGQARAARRAADSRGLSHARPTRPARPGRAVAGGPARARSRQGRPDHARAGRDRVRTQSRSASRIAASHRPTACAPGSGWPSARSPR